MPTTSPAHAQAVLDGLTATGVHFAVLHGEASAAAGQVASDVDVAVAGSPGAAVRRLLAVGCPAGLTLVMVWPYDVNSLTTFWMTAAGDGVQLDLVGDPSGDSAYGLRTPVLLRHVELGVRWPRLAAEAERLYLLSKRDLKRDEVRLAELLDLDPATRAALVALADTAVAPWRRGRMVALLTGRRPVPAARRRVRGRALVMRRVASRALRPVGQQIRLDGLTMEGAQEMSEALGRVLPSAVRSAGHPFGGLRAYARLVRPCLVVRPDHEGEAAAPPDRQPSLADLVAVANSRAVRRLRTID